MSESKSHRPNGELARCLREQQKCRAYLANDWLAEEILIRLESAEDRQRQTDSA